MNATELLTLRKNVLELTQHEMAKEMGISRASLARLEASDGPIPRHYELAAHRMADVFFLERAPVEYLELIDALKQRLHGGKDAGLLVTNIYELLGAHRHTCETPDCGQRFWCFCAYPSQGHRCHDCELERLRSEEEFVA